MKQKILTCTVLFALLFSLCSCGDRKNKIPENPKMNIEIITQDGNQSLTRYNGDAQEFFEVEDGSEVVVELMIQQQSGTLRIMIQDENNPENTVYDGNTFPSEAFTVSVMEPGTYRVWIHAKDFVGVYQLQYNLKRP